jgi:hypothetical protein
LYFSQPEKLMAAKKNPNIVVMILGATAALAASGCQTVPFLQSAQPQAIAAAQQKGAFEMNCPAATGQLINSENVQEPMGTIRFSPTPRAAYTVGVSGCNKRVTYTVICAEGGGCIAGDGHVEQ